MTRTMYDSVQASAIPVTAQLVAGYVDGLYAWSPADWRRFPNSVHVPICVDPAHGQGVVLDVENGDARPDQAPGWVRERRAAGVDPTVYTGLSQWQAVQDAFNRAWVPHPHYWIAAYPGDGAVLPTLNGITAVAHQYADPATSGGSWDLSVVADYWPGIDQGAPDMQTTDIIGKRPDGSPITVGDALANLYLGAYFGGGDAGTPAGLGVFRATADVHRVLVEPGTVVAHDSSHTKTNLSDLIADAASWQLAENQAVTALAGQVTANEAQLLGALKSLSTGQIDVTAFAAAAAPAIAALIPKDASPDEFVAALAAHLTK